MKNTQKQLSLLRISVEDIKADDTIHKNASLKLIIHGYIRPKT